MRGYCSGDMKRYRITNRQYNSKNCFICGLENNYGLKARFYETEGKEVIAVCTPQKEHRSYPNTTHGGVTAALLGETIVRAICAHYGDMVWGVMMELNIKYRKQVPYDSEVKIIGRITRDNGRLFEGEGELICDGRAAASAMGLYMKSDIVRLGGENFVDDEWGFIDEENMPEEIEL